MILFAYLAAFLLQRLAYRWYSRSPIVRDGLLPFVLFIHFLLPMLLIPDPVYKDDGGHCLMPDMASGMIRMVLRFFGLAFALIIHCLVMSKKKAAEKNGS